MKQSLVPGDIVILTALPRGLLDGLPDAAQRAIVAMVGRAVRLVAFDESGRAEVEFDDPFEPRTEASSHTHQIWVAPEFLRKTGPELNCS